MALEARLSVNGGVAVVDSVPEGHRPLMAFQDADGRVYFIARNIETEKLDPKTQAAELLKRLWEDGTDLLYIGNSGEKLEFVQNLTPNELKTEGPDDRGFGAVFVRFDSRGHKGTLYQRICAKENARLVNYNGKAMDITQLEIAGKKH